MKILATIVEAQALPNAKRRVLVPTMGALHKAHGELIRVARQAAGKDGEVAVSIFAGVDFLFRPSVEEVYPTDRSTFVEETSLSSRLEGQSRPGHFRGVCTVVAKLFNIVAPDAAVFGEKDFQQLAIVRHMVRDLNFNIDIIAVPTVREKDGLACSSRNQYLNSDERNQATVLYKALEAAANAGKKSANDIVALARQVISEAALARIDYVELVDAESLEPTEMAGPNSVLLLAVYFGKTRLIDNVRLP